MRLSILLAIVLPTLGHCQLYENFEEAYFGTPPIWQGDTLKFEIRAGALHSNSDIPYDQFSLFTDFAALDSFECRSKLQLDLRTSSANYVVLSLDSLALQFGNSKDAITLIYGNEPEIRLGPESVTEFSSWDIRIAKQKNTLYIKLKSEELEIEHRVSMATFRPTRFGIEITQSTSSFFSKHYFDELYIGPILADTLAPSITELTRSDSSTVLVQWSEELSGIDQLLVDGNVAPFRIALDSLFIGQAPAWAEGEHHLRLLGVQDTAGNDSDTSFHFYYHHPHAATKGELVINEILFDPYPDEFDFIELYNLSSSSVDLDELALARWKDGKITELQAIKTSDGFLKAGNFLLLSVQPSRVCNIYPCPQEMDSLRMDLPSMNNDEGTLLLLSNSVIIDSLHYEASYHSSLLFDTEGVSLEKIDPSAGNTLTNWTSAAASVNYASPAQKNSNYPAPDLDHSITLVKQVITPNGDGIDDLLFLRLNGLPVGSVVTTYLFNKTGHLLSIPYNHLSVAQMDLLKIEPLDRDGKLLIPGTYILLFPKLRSSGPRC